MHNLSTSATTELLDRKEWFLQKTINRHNNNTSLKKNEVIETFNQPRVVKPPQPFTIPRLNSHYLTAANCSNGVFTIPNNVSMTRLYVKNQTMSNPSQILNEIFQNTHLNMIITCMTEYNNILYFGVNDNQSSIRFKSGAIFPREKVYSLNRLTGEFDVLTGGPINRYVNNNAVKDLLVYNGYLYACGGFSLLANNNTQVCGLAKMNIATGTWSPVGTATNIPSGLNTCMTLVQNSSNNYDIYIGGFFSSFNGTPSNRIVKFNSTSQEFIYYNNGPTSGNVFCIANDGTYVYLGGDFGTTNSISGSERFVRLRISDNEWSKPISLFSITSSLIINFYYNNNKLYMAGSFVTSKPNTQCFATFNTNDGSITSPTYYPKLESSVSPNFITKMSKLSSTGDLYFTGTSLELISLSDNTLNYYAIWKYNVTTNTWSGLTANPGQQSSFAFVDSGNTFYSGDNSRKLYMYTPDYMQLKYNGKILCNLFWNQSALVNTRVVTGRVNGRTVIINRFVNVFLLNPTIDKPSQNTIIPIEEIFSLFSGELDVSNWTKYITYVDPRDANSTAYIDTGNAPTSITMTSDTASTPSETKFFITIPSPQIITFNWSYTSDAQINEKPNETIEHNDDPFYYTINNNTVMLTPNYFLKKNESGTISLYLQKGDTFGFMISTKSGEGGKATVTIQGTRKLFIP